MRLNLGAADRHIEGFLCFDIAPPPCEVCGDPAGRVVDLGAIWPWEDSMAEEVLALDVCEHIPDCVREVFLQNTALGPKYRRKFVSGRIWFLNELHRVLIPGGRATIETPNAAKGVGYFQDPTHCAPYCLSTFKYFESGAFAHQRLSKAYGITAAFKVLSLTESRSNGEATCEEVWKIKAVLEAVKP